jgi:vacuolar protein sorting-associated protein 51
MRANMDPLNPITSTLDPAIAEIYAQASSIREHLRSSVPKPPTDSSDSAQQSEQDKKAARQHRTQQLAREVLGTPARLRELVEEGKIDEAAKLWEMPRRLLEIWLAKNVGGDEEVRACLQEGDAALKEEESVEGSSGRSSREVSQGFA